MSTNFDTVELVADTSDGGPDLDIGLGAPSGADGLDATGYTFSQPFPGIIRVTGSDQTIQDFALPQGLPGKPGENGVTPLFIGGTITLQPFGSTPALVVKSTSTPNTYAVDLYLPDASISATLANQYAGIAQGASITATNAATTATDAALASKDSRRRYLGAFASNPTTDTYGDALQVGATYYNTSTTPKALRIWDGSAWAAAYTAVAGAVSSFNGRSGAVAASTNDYAVADINGLTSALNAKLSVLQKASSAEAIAGTDDTKYTTPASITAALSTRSTPPWALMGTMTVSGGATPVTIDFTGLVAGQKELLLTARNVTTNAGAGGSFFRLAVRAGGGWGGDQVVAGITPSGTHALALHVVNANSDQSLYTVGSATGTLSPFVTGRTDIAAAGYIRCDGGVEGLRISADGNTFTGGTFQIFKR